MLLHTLLPRHAYVADAIAITPPLNMPPRYLMLRRHAAALRPLRYVLMRVATVPLLMFCHAISLIRHASYATLPCRYAITDAALMPYAVLFICHCYVTPPLFAAVAITSFSLAVADAVTRLFFSPLDATADIRHIATIFFIMLLSLFRFFPDRRCRCYFRHAMQRYYGYAPPLLLCQRCRFRLP